jgi:hypothetical protein
MRTANKTPRSSSYLEASVGAAERASSDPTKASRLPNGLLVGLSALAGEPVTRRFPVTTRRFS